MAVSGGGTSWSDPYIVDNWADFLTVMSSGYVKFANPHEEGGVFVLSGSGTSTDPYIVSTYEEMLFATGASYIYQVKLIDRDTKMYKYGDIYCIYDDSLTTIDFNDITPSGYTSGIEIRANVDFNGWTLRNIRINTGGYIALSSLTKNMRLLNTLVFDASPFGWFNNVHDSIIQIEQYSSVSNPTFTTAGNLYNSSLSVYNRSNSSYKMNGGRNTFYVYNSKIHADMDSENGYVIFGDMKIDNSLITGRGNGSTISGNNFIYWITNSIIDLEYDNSMTFYIASNTIYNSDKIPNQSPVSGLTGLTTEQLKTASEIAATGFPIGVD